MNEVAKNGAYAAFDELQKSVASDTHAGLIGIAIVAWFVDKDNAKRVLCQDIHGGNVDHFGAASVALHHAGQAVGQFAQEASSRILKLEGPVNEG